MARTRGSGGRRRLPVFRAPTWSKDDLRAWSEGYVAFWERRGYVIDRWGQIVRKDRAAGREATQDPDGGPGDAERDLDRDIEEVIILSTHIIEFDED
jgi:hypothetical protein